MEIEKQLENLIYKTFGTKVEFCNTANMPKATLVNVLNRGISKTSFATIAKIAAALNIDANALADGVILPLSSTIENLSPVNFVSFKVCGRIAAGFDGEMVEEYMDEVVPIPKETLRGRPQEDYIMLKVRGDSMAPQFLNGDNVLILKSPSVDSGTIAAVAYNWIDASLKKVVYVEGEDWVELIPLNIKYKPLRIEGPDLDGCHVIGKAVALFRNF